MKTLSFDKMKERELELLKKVDTICRENGINYSIAYGTLLGAVRHKGFIPWDDDIDIWVKRDDYNRLKEIINSDIKKYNFKFIDIYSQPDSIYPFGKISDQNTVLEEEKFKKVENLGINIDVFPIDNFPDNRIRKFFFKKKARFYALLITHCSRMEWNKCDNFGRNILRYLAFKFSRVFNEKKLIERLYKLATKYNDRVTKKVGSVWDNPEYESSFLEHTSYIDFENFKFQASNNFDDILKKNYNNYMELPPESQRVARHNFIVYDKEH